ncbi:MAG: CvpA family protein [Nitrospinae bacterium]|nr:CvpA family protein [Nitrospinota bacterium]
MTTFDIIVCSILGLSMVLSLFKGFVKELFSLLSYLGGFLMASKYQGTFSQTLMESIPSKPIAKVIAFVAIYILTAIIISLMGKVAKGMMYSGNQLSKFDRIMGGVVGLGRGAVIVVALTFPLQFFPKVGEKLTKDSITAPYIAETLAYLNKNPGALNFRKKLTDSIDLDGAKQKFEELKNLKNMSGQFEDLKKNLPNLGKDSKSGEKSLDNYSKEDLQKLNDILKSVEKNQD